MTPRLAAVNVLLAIERGRATLSGELEKARRRIPARRDRALLTELTTGTLRWQAALDALLAQCSRRPLADLDPVVRLSLRLAAYQLEHLARVPAHAVLSEAVDTVRTLGAPSAAGFVNGVLRTLTRTRSRLALPPRPAASASREAQLAYLSTSLSHPRWLAARWLDRFGFDAAERWCRFNNAPPGATLRPTGGLDRDAALGALRAAGIDARPARVVADAIALPAGALGRVPDALLDRLIVQDEAAQAVAHAAGAQPGERVLDVCAAPGGKTVVLATALQGRGQLVAGDVRARRVRLLQRTLRQARVPAFIVALDATRPLPFGPVFDRVLVDAPCSGLGVVRRDPDLKWSRQPDDLPAFARIELRMLAHAADAVAPGGRLIYATCSSEPDENDVVVEHFLAGDARFSREPLRPGPRLLGGHLIDANGYFRTLPFRDDLDAFFAAGLRRTG